MAEMDLGRVIPLYKGDYYETRKYELNDVVRYNGSLYWHKSKDETLNIPPTNTKIWKIALDIGSISEYIDNKTAEIAEISREAAASADEADAAATAALNAEEGAEAVQDRLIDAVETAEGFGSYACFIDNKTTIGPYIATERVEGGVKILNPLWSDKLMANLGFYYDESEGKMYLYNLFITPSPGINGRFTTLVLMSDVNPEGEAYELTIGNAPNIASLSNTQTKWKARNPMAITPGEHGEWVRDVRLARQLIDAEGNETRYYSAQYRYNLSNGVMTRTRFETEPVDDECIIEVGYTKQDNSVPLLINGHYLYSVRGEAHTALFPAITTKEPVSYSMVIPDSYFADATYGVSICVRSGSGDLYEGPTFFAPEEPSGGLPKVTQADNGDVLTVVDGAWAKATPQSSQPATSYIKFTWTQDDPPAPSGWVVQDMSGETAANLERVKNIVINHAPLIFRITDSIGDMYYPEELVFEYGNAFDENTYYQCLHVSAEQAKVTVYRITIPAEMMTSVSDMLMTRIPLNYTI